MTSLTYNSPQEWHAIRAKHVGSSEVSALFGLHPFGLTRWQLWHHKRGTLPHDVDNTSVRQGQHFEPAIASYAQEKFGIRLRKVHRYLSADDCPGLGASIDYEEFGVGLGLIPTELKWSVWGDGWDYTGDDLTACPDAYLLQVQAQLACSGAPHGQLLAFTGGDLRRMVIPRSEKLIAGIHAETTAFWKSIEDGKEAPCDFAKDGDAIAELAYRTPMRTITVADDQSHLFGEYEGARLNRLAWEKTEKAAKGAAIKAILDAGPIGNDDKAVAVCGKWEMKLTKVADSPGKEITADMVGRRIGEKAGHLRITVKGTEE